MSKRAITVLAVIWLLIFVTFSTVAITLSLAGLSFESFSVVASADDSVTMSAEAYDTIKRYERTQEVLDIIKNDYYIDVDENALLTGSIRGLLGALGDPYTFYYTPDEMSQHNEHNNGLYEGIGIQLIAGKDGSLLITRTFKNGSAQNAGIRAGDKIVAVEGESVNALTTQNMNDAINKIKGLIDTAVSIAVDRDGELMTFSMMRSKIVMNRVEYQMLEGDIGYIMIYEFMGDAVLGFKDAVAALSNAKAFIIDVRSNPGGLLTDVVSIADIVLPEGLIVYIEDRAGKRETYYSDSTAFSVPLAVLTNNMSASASEILAGSVQDYGIGIIVGENTFGKGLVQSMIPFRSDGAGVQLTTARYFTPNGRMIHDVGIKPDFEVTLGEEYDATVIGPDPSNDAQLRTAVSELEKMIAGADMVPVP